MGGAGAGCVAEMRKAVGEATVVAAGTAGAPELPDLEDATAQQVLEWAIDRYSAGLTIATSLEDTVLVDMAYRIDSGVEFFFLETAFHFEETLQVIERVRQRYDGVNLVMLEPVDDPAVWSEDGYEACCNSRKVLPMNNHLRTKQAWVTGVKRVDAPTRAHTKHVEWDVVRGLVKINPLARWTDDDVADYEKQNGLITHPLKSQGYGSIGCAPCTVPGSGREGRWAGSGKVECGLHVTAAQESS